MVDNSEVLEQYTPQELDLIRAGREAHATLKKTFDFYTTKIGPVLMIGSKHCALRVGAKWPNPKGGRYTAEFSKWLNNGGGHPDCEWVREYAEKRNKTLRIRLMQCMAQLPEINAWKEDNPVAVHLNNPQTVLNAFRKYEKDKAGGPKPEKKLGLKEEVARLQELTDNQQAEINRLNSYRIIHKSKPEAMTDKLLKGNPAIIQLSVTEFDAFIKVLRGSRLSRQVKAANAESDEEDAVPLKKPNRVEKVKAAIVKRGIKKRLSPTKIAAEVEAKIVEDCLDADPETIEEQVREELVEANEETIQDLAKVRQQEIIDDEFENVLDEVLDEKEHL